MDTRELILDRIGAMKARDAQPTLQMPGFDKRNGRWSHLEVEGVHISEVVFEELSPDQLVFIFEHIVRRFYTQRG